MVVLAKDYCVMLLSKENFLPVNITFYMVPNSIHIRNVNFQRCNHMQIDITLVNGY